MAADPAPPVSAMGEIVGILAVILVWVICSYGPVYAFLWLCEHEG